MYLLFLFVSQTYKLKVLSESIIRVLLLSKLLLAQVYDQGKDFLDMSEDLLRRSRILVLCGTGVDETVLNDIAIANRFHIASSTLDGIRSVEKKISKGSEKDGE